MTGSIAHFKSKTFNTDNSQRYDKDAFVSIHRTRSARQLGIPGDLNLCSEVLKEKLLTQ